MQQRLWSILGLIVLATAAFAAVPAGAQTVAPGPYYATPSWDQTLACTTLATCPRFIVLSNMNSDAVLDRETGLVWEKSPSTSRFHWSTTTAKTAGQHCAQLSLGNRKGWKLPTIQELASLIDPSVAAGLTLPPGHPFQNVQPDGYWSATGVGSGATFAWVALFDTGDEGFGDKDLATFFVWCVRGGQGVDNQ